MLVQFQSRLAKAYGAVGQVDKGIELLKKVISEQGERSAYWADVQFTLGELLMQSGTGSSEAERWIRQAIENARRQELKSWELRATLSLARLLRKQGRADEARKMLAEIYGWFTEGFDTADLKDAKALLEELNSEARG